MRFPPLRFGLALLTTALLTACGGSDPVTPPPPVTIALSPTSATVGAGGTTTFTATVANSENTAVTWTASAGTIASAGTSATLTAPVTGGTVTVTATSTADPAKSASASVTVTPVRVMVSPATSTLYRTQPLALTATVTGAGGDSSVSWSASCGTVATTATAASYIAPATAGSCTVTARSVLDTTQSASLTVTVRPDRLVTTTDDALIGACDWSHCSLREALVAANDAANGDTVRVGDDAVGKSVTGTITLTGPLPALTRALHLVGPGAATLAIDAGASAASPRRVLDVSGATAVLSVRGVTLRGGLVTSSGGAGLRVQSGADVTLTDVHIVDNELRDGSGGAGVLASSASTLRMTDVVIARNRAVSTSTFPRFGGGMNAIDATIVMQGGALRENVNERGAGGGLRALNSRITLTDVEVRENRALTTSGQGGGLYLEGATGTLQLTRVQLLANEATSSGGGLFVRDLATAQIDEGRIANNASDVLGGGLAVSSVPAFSMQGTRVDGNTAVLGGGGAVFAGVPNASLATLDIDDNAVLAGGVQSGGGLLLEGSTVAVLREVRVRRNRVGGADGYGGGVQLRGNSTLHMQRGEVTDNTVASTAAPTVTNVAFGGGISASQSTVTLDTVRVSGNSARAGGGLSMTSAGRLTVRGGEISDNVATTGNGGGALLSGLELVSMRRVEVRNNEARQQGGGLSFAGTGDAIIQQSRIIDNRAQGAGGGIASAVRLTLASSLVAGNRAGGTGGGLLAASPNATVVRTSTFSGNSGTIGGGIGTTGPTTITNVTLVGNSASTLGGGVGAGGFVSPSLSSVLLAGNRLGTAPQNCGAVGSTPITSGGHNLSDDASCTSFTLGTDKPNTPAGVSDTLADLGGPTRTHALLAGSAAIDAGRPSTCPGTDQRDYLIQGVCDIGAFEFGSVPAPPEGSVLPASAMSGSVRRSPARSARQASGPSTSTTAYP